MSDNNTILFRSRILLLLYKDTFFSIILVNDYYKRQSPYYS